MQIKGIKELRNYELKNLENDEERTSCSKSIMLRKIRQIRLLLRSPLLSPYFPDYN